MRILCIGNSFSQDAARYLHQIAASDGAEIEVWNLYIGGCPLERHWSNMENRLADYLLEINGVSKGNYVDAQTMLERNDWDFVTLQQVSQSSVDYGTYQPALNRVNDFVREKAPAAKRLIHQTWAYAPDSPRLTEELGYHARQEMFRDLERAYQRAADAIKADGIIPSGAVFEAMQDQTDARMYRDGFHASLGIGRYVLGLLWYGYLTGRPVRNVSFETLYEPVSAAGLEQARQVVSQVLERLK